MKFYIWLRTTLTILIPGSMGGILVLLYQLTGGFRIHGYWRLIYYMFAYQCRILVTNHISMLEPALFAFMFWPWNIISKRFFMWSMPHKSLLKEKYHWIFDLGRAIPVERGRDIIAAFNRLEDLVRKGETAVLHPEGKRKSTGDPADLIHLGERSVLPMTDKIPRIAYEVGAWIIPIYIVGTDEVLPRNKAWTNPFRARVHFYVGQPYRPTWENRANWQTEIEQAILTAGYRPGSS